MDKEKVSLTVGLCAHRECTLETTTSLVNLAGKVPFSLIVSKGAYIGKAREDLARAVVENKKSTHLLFVDTDMLFEASDVGRLFSALAQDPRRGAVSGHYIKWDKSNFPVCKWEGLDVKKNTAKAQKLSKKGGVHEVDGFGAGFLLIDCKALSSIEPPWFINEEFAGEDYYFCKKLKNSGFTPCVDFSVKLGHVGPSVWKP